MNDPAAPIKVGLRIPGKWSHPRELLERLPDGCRLKPESLFLPDGTEFEFGAMDADDEFAQIFRSSCRDTPTDDELATVDHYTVNVLVSGPGGSLPKARALMQAGAAIVQAGGAGVFIDNSGLAHGGQQWLAMADDGGPDAISFAFVTIVGGRTDVYTMGMHILGYRDLVMKRTDLDTGDMDIVEVIRYVSGGEKPIGDGHIIANLDGPRFRTLAEDSPAELAASPMHNPFGRLKLVSMRDIAETN